MSASDKSLGRGLNALFNNQATADEESRQEESPLLSVEIDQLVPNPNQPRQYFNDEKLAELANSIQIKGILQPILARPTDQEGKWEIVAGERRWRAAKMAGLKKIPILARDMNSNDALISAMMENLHREDLNPIEEARGLSAMKDILGLSQAELAATLGVQRGTISNMLRILNLSEKAQDDLIHGRITQGHARCLVVLPEEESEILRQRIIELGMSVRATEMALSFWQQSRQFPWNTVKKERKPRSRIDPDMRKIAMQISNRLNCRARIKGTSEEGKINLSYNTNAQLYEILEKLGLSLEDQQ